MNTDEVVHEAVPENDVLDESVIESPVKPPEEVAVSTDEAVLMTPAVELQTEQMPPKKDEAESSADTELKPDTPPTENAVVAADDRPADVEQIQNNDTDKNIKKRKLW